MLWMWAAFADVEPKPEEEVSETVFSWAKPFKRFDDTRWVVRSEVITPTPAQLGSVETPIRANAWQIEAIIHCQLEDERGRLREANCTVEDAALRIHSPRHGRPRDQVAIEHTRSLIVGSRMQLQVNHKGGVPNLDVEGIEEDNYDERRLQGGVHQIMRVLSAAFHMNISKSAPLRTDWESTREPLLTMPAMRVGPSSNRIANRIDPVNDHWIWQSIGKATSRSPVPHPMAGMVCMGLIKPCRSYRYPEYQGDLHFTYAIDFNAVTVIDPGKGYPVERLWSSFGRPTPSSPGSVTATDYWSAGNLRELEDDEMPELGSTGVVGEPLKDGGELAPWVSVAQSWWDADAKGAAPVPQAE